MRTFVAIVIGLSLLGCDHRKPVVSDTDLEAFRAENPGMTQECLENFRYGGMAAWRPDDPDCFEMLPAQRWSGLWVHGFEWTNFCPDPAKSCSVYGEPGESWLKFGEGIHFKEPPPEGLYHVEFVGRRTKTPGHFGHLSQYDHLMIVDKLLSIRKLPERAKDTAK